MPSAKIAKRSGVCAKAVNVSCTLPAGMVTLRSHVVGLLLPVQHKRVPAVVVRYGRHPFA
jgi:hypothetical protein